MLYLEQRFSLALGPNELDLEPVGAQMIGDFLWMYQEQSEVPPPETLQARITLMQEYFPEQRHLLNLNIGGEIKTLRLNRDQPHGTF